MADVGLEEAPPWPEVPGAGAGIGDAPDGSGVVIQATPRPTILEGLSRRAGVNSGNPHNPAKCRWTGGGKSLCGFRNRCWNGGAWPSVTREVPGRGARMGQRRGCKNLLTRKEAASRVPGGRCELLTSRRKVLARRYAGGLPLGSSAPRLCGKTQAPGMGEMARRDHGPGTGGSRQRRPRHFGPYVSAIAARSDLRTEIPLTAEGSRRGWKRKW